MQLTDDSTVSAKPTTPESRKATADELERIIGPLLGKMKAKDIPVEPIVSAVQGLRDAAALYDRAMRLVREMADLATWALDSIGPDEGATDDGWKSDALEARIAEGRRRIASVPIGNAPDRAASAPLAGLHAAILNLGCFTERNDPTYALGYTRGHKDARHAAAELVAAAGAAS